MGNEGRILMSYRQIKFRGKNNKSQWVYGALIPPEFSSWYEPSIFDGNLRAEVDGETLGQYTGCMDIEHNEIYEGDILEFTLSDTIRNHVETFRSVVQYVAGTWEVRADKEVAYNFIWLMTNEFLKAKIVGNIHDNPELLEETK